MKESFQSRVGSSGPAHLRPELRFDTRAEPSSIGITRTASRISQGKASNTCAPHERIQAYFELIVCTQPPGCDPTPAWRPCAAAWQPTVPCGPIGTVQYSRRE